MLGEAAESNAHAEPNLDRAEEMTRISSLAATVNDKFSSGAALH
jgi:hypothetical protein